MVYERTWIRDKENCLVSFGYPSTMGEIGDDLKTLRELFSPITVHGTHKPLF